MPFSYVALWLGWWGHGVGDGWQYIALILTLGTVMVCSALVYTQRPSSVI
ncbi:hypothetical protein G1H11_11985 [Phytoactinopolyspora alkaliphila]|uniref:Uncharacterized protein n=1 Tax=Phytoactinopolyspora alkaliphila TaxID=1783498 RepID=A0A6N9YM82_9ACTN|nr:hypothetical protein [Phytoactinopolyspora alkaliphila]NED96030.1 hypothetical protein [Phytoactinopolyspora alkaliphila]